MIYIQSLSIYIHQTYIEFTVQYKHFFIWEHVALYGHWQQIHVWIDLHAYFVLPDVMCRRDTCTYPLWYNRYWCQRRARIWTPSQMGIDCATKNIIQSMCGTLFVPGKHELDRFDLYAMSVMNHFSCLNLNCAQDKEHNCLATLTCLTVNSEEWSSSSMELYESQTIGYFKNIAHSQAMLLNGYNRTEKVWKRADILQQTCLIG